MKGCVYNLKERYTEHTKPFSYITSPLFDKYGVPHAFTRRGGGVSEGVYSSLNFAAGGGEDADKWENVVQNHRIAASLFGLTEKDVCRTNQTHSTTVLAVDAGYKGTGIVTPPFPEGVDGLVCRERDMLLTVRGADCVTLLFYDTKRDIYGACHSGWRGTAGKISVATIEAMRSMGAAADDIIVAIGPSVGGCCYTVGGEVKNAFLEADGDFAACFRQEEKGTVLNLQKAVEISLIKAGVKEENISDCGECTVCDGGKHYFSHRLCGNKRGTMAAFIKGKE